MMYDRHGHIYTPPDQRQTDPLPPITQPVPVALQGQTRAFLGRDVFTAVTLPGLPDVSEVPTQPVVAVGVPPAQLPAITKQIKRAKQLRKRDKKPVQLRPAPGEYSDRMLWGALIPAFASAIAAWVRWPEALAIGVIVAILWAVLWMIGAVLWCLFRF